MGIIIPANKTIELQKACSRFGYGYGNLTPGLATVANQMLRLKVPVEKKSEGKKRTVASWGIPPYPVHLNALIYGAKDAFLHLLIYRALQDRIVAAGVGQFEGELGNAFYNTVRGTLERIQRTRGFYSWFFKGDFPSRLGADLKSMDLARVVLAVVTLTREKQKVPWPITRPKKGRSMELTGVLVFDLLAYFLARWHMVFRDPVTFLANMVARFRPEVGPGAQGHPLAEYLCHYHLLLGAAILHLLLVRKERQ